jgi:5-methyltetrahydrofolate--homocysteine methyltransferase
MGDPLAAALQELAEAGADAVGANCSIASAAMRELALEALAATPLPVVLQPNAGTPELTGDAVVYRQTPEEFADDVAAMTRAGVRAVGGCCGTDPRFIAALCARLGGGPAELEAAP